MNPYIPARRRTVERSHNAQHQKAIDGDSIYTCSKFVSERDFCLSDAEATTRPSKRFKRSLLAENGPWFLGLEAVLERRDQVRFRLWERRKRKSLLMKNSSYSTSQTASPGAEQAEDSGWVDENAEKTITSIDESAPDLDNQCIPNSQLHDTPEASPRHPPPSQSVSQSDFPSALPSVPASAAQPGLSSALQSVPASAAQPDLSLATQPGLPSAPEPAGPSVEQPGLTSLAPSDLSSAALPDLPSPDLLRSIHHEAMSFYNSRNMLSLIIPDRGRKPVGWEEPIAMARAFNGTALMAIGVLMEEITKDQIQSQTQISSVDPPEGTT